MNKKLFWLYTLSASVYFTQGIESLPLLPITFFFKNTLHLTESRVMFLMSWITLAWLIKPLIGHYVDKISKKACILISLLLSIIFAITLGLLPLLPIFWLIILMMFSSSSTAIRDIATDAIASIEGKRFKITGRLQSVSWGFLTFAGILTGVLGGYISQHFSYQTAYLLLIPIYLLIMLIVNKYKEESISLKTENMWQTLKVLVKDKHLLLVCLFLFLYKLSPSFGMPITYILQDKFGWSQTFIGLQDTISACVSLIGAWIYFHYSKKINLIKWLTIFIFIGAVTTLCYLFLTPFTYMLYNILFSMMGMFVTLLLLDFMAQNTKSGFEAMSFALLCSVSNLTATINGFSGSFLLPIVGLKWLIIISALTSFICLPLIPRLNIGLDKQE
jgi:MFS family permease